MSLENHWWDGGDHLAVRGRTVRALALAFLVLLAPMGAVGDYARADAGSVSVAESNLPKSDLQPTGTIERIHSAGITGANVSVGVLDVTGFESDSPALAGQVADVRSFGPGQDVPRLGRNAHGTATASIVANVAPDAEFYLASFTTKDGYRHAVDWFIQRDVDVIVVPVSFYGQPRDSAANVSRTLQRATGNGITVVTAAGNIANSYWRGAYEPDARGRLQFDGDARNYVSGTDSRAVIWLSWTHEATGQFSVELYRDGLQEPVATSKNYTRDSTPNGRLTATIDPDEEYYFVVRGPPIATRPILTVESPTHTFETTHRHGSVTQPGVSDDVITVGAFDVGESAVAPYSGAGPVDSNPGVDVVGYTNLVAPGYPAGFEGTSSSAAYVGGLAVLVHDVDPDATPGHVESLLERTARDVGRAGPDTVSGYGIAEPEPLIELARNESAAREPESTETVNSMP